MSDGISLRALTPDDWQILRSARLKAGEREIPGGQIGGNTYGLW
jgi:hypothetical protein